MVTRPPMENSSVTPKANMSCGNLDIFMVLTQVEQRAIGSICLLAGPFTLLENALVLFLIASSTALRRRPSYLFMGSLALADMLASCFYTASFVDFHLFHRKDSPTTYLLKLGGVTLSFSSSVGSLLLTAIDRFLCLYRAARYKAVMTRRRALLALLLLWSTTLLISFLPLLGWRCSTGLSPPCSHLFPYISTSYLACWTSCILLVLGLILAAYGLILWKAHRHQVSMSTQQGASRQASLRMDIRLARTLSLILLILVGCWLPVLSFMLADVSMVLSKAQKRAFAFCSALCLVNSAINPVLYTLRCQELRLALVRLLPAGRACCRRSAGTHPSDSGQSQAEASKTGVSSYGLGAHEASRPEETREEQGGAGEQEEETRGEQGGSGEQEEETRGEPKINEDTVNAS